MRLKYVTHAKHKAVVGTDISIFIFSQYYINKAVSHTP